MKLCNTSPIFPVLSFLKEKYAFDANESMPLRVLFLSVSLHKIHLDSKFLKSVTLMPKVRPKEKNSETWTRIKVRWMDFIKEFPGYKENDAVIPVVILYNVSMIYET